MCRNEWKEGICQKPCRACSHADYIPLSDQLILDHFQGRHILGCYPLLKDNTCHFIASDFDNHGANGATPLKDVHALNEVCQVSAIPAYFLRSKGGNGYHAYLFFESPIPAWKARIAYFALLQEAGGIGDDVELTSFDRLFPNQDELSGKEFGNLIALPFQGMAAKKKHTLFLDPATRFAEPFKDQWQTLATLEKIPESKLDELIQEWKLERGPIQVQPPTNSNAKASEKLPDCKFIQWCKETPSEVSEPLWFALISNVICVRPGGYTLAHRLSAGYPQYTPSETDAKILHTLDGPGPHTCKYIKENGFKCGCDCGVKAPASLLFRKPNGDPEDDRAEIHFIRSEGNN